MQLVVNSRVIFTVALIAGSAGRCQILAQEASSPDQLSAIRLNTIGYQPISRKEATVAGTDKEFLIRDLESDKEVYRGQLSRSDANRAEAASLLVADFSSLTREGSYRLEVGSKRSSEFVISADVYNWPFFAVMRGM